MPYIREASVGHYQEVLRILELIPVRGARSRRRKKHITTATLLAFWKYWGK